MEKKIASSRLWLFLQEYLKMEIFGTVINCPYWMNRIRKGKVIYRGFKNGKGTPQEIKEELMRQIQRLPQKEKKAINRKKILQLARRKRIGLDCSGFVFQVLDFFLREKFPSSPFLLRDIFPSGINRTNAKRLTDKKNCFLVKNVSLAQPGDLIRLMGGRHIAIVLEVKEKEIIYGHSSRYTEIEGVHLGKIKIKVPKQSLGFQIWEEKTKEGENYGQKYYSEEKGDGLFRLKIFEEGER